MKLMVRERNESQTESADSAREAVVSLAAVPRIATVERERQTTLSDRRCIRVLVAEDLASEAAALRSTLDATRRTVFEIDNAYSFLDAVDTLEEAPYDVVLLDLSLPDMPGLVALHALRRLFPHVPVVVTTDLDDEALGEQAVSEGAQDYYLKGTQEHHVLSRCIRYAIERQRVLDDLERHASDARATEKRMTRLLELLRQGIAQLNAGDLGVRVADALKADGFGREMLDTVEQFDRAVENLQQVAAFNSEFYIMAAHDMRSPLCTVLMAARQLETVKVPADRERLLAIVMNRTRRQLRLVESVLDYYTLRSGQCELARDWADVNELMLQCASELARQAEERGQRIVVEPMAGDANLWCDPSRLFRVLDNLVGNAIKYSSEGDQIVLRASRDAGGVRFEVIDHGPGLERAQQERLFERVSRASNGGARNSSSRGYGIGLAVCKHTVDAHAGRIWIESEPGKGCRFLFIVPSVAPSREHLPFESRAGPGA